MVFCRKKIICRNIQRVKKLGVRKGRIESRPKGINQASCKWPCERKASANGIRKPLKFNNIYRSQFYNKIGPSKT